MGYPKIVVKPPGPKAREVVERDHAIISPVSIELTLSSSNQGRVASSPR